MKTITVVTMIYLPVTFVAVCVLPMDFISVTDECLDISEYGHFRFLLSRWHTKCDGRTSPKAGYT